MSCRSFTTCPSASPLCKARTQPQQGSCQQRRGCCAREICASASERRWFAGDYNPRAWRGNGYRNPLPAGAGHPGGIFGPCYGTHRHRYVLRKRCFNASTLLVKLIHQRQFLHGSMLLGHTLCHRLSEICAPHMMSSVQLCVTMCCAVVERQSSKTYTLQCTCSDCGPPCHALAV